MLDVLSEAREREGLRVGIDTFPDPWGPAHLLDLAPPWVYEGPEDEVLDRLRDPETAEKCRAHFETPTNFLLRLGGFDKFFLSTSNAHPSWLAGRWKMSRAIGSWARHRPCSRWPRPTAPTTPTC